MPKKKKTRSWYSHFTKLTAHVSGRPYTFIGAAALIVIWAVSGPIFGFSDTWQLVINTSTTIITFLMVFIIQSTQNRDTEAMQIKLDELIRANEAAKNLLLDLEEIDEEELEGIRGEYLRIAKEARKQKKAK